SLFPAIPACVSRRLRAISRQHSGTQHSGIKTDVSAARWRSTRRIKMKSKQLALFLIGFVAIFAFTSQAFAREPVDPSTLNPPPRANTICERVGNGIICDVQFSDPPFAGGSRVICGTGANAYEVSQFLNRSVRGKRYYDQNGNLLRRHFREVLSGTFSNPQNNAAVSFSGQDTHLHYLATPGDVSSGTDIVTMNPDGTNIKQLTHVGPDGLASWPAWSADGKQIVFEFRPPDRIPQIWVMNADGSDQHLVFAEQDFGENRPSFSPDGTKL